VINPASMFGTDIDVDAALEDPLDLLDLWLARVERGAPGDTGAAGDTRSPHETSTADGARAPGDTSGTDFLSTPLMALATVDAEGYPRVRHVLLSAHDRGRLHFHTDERSAKAAQLAANPRAGATIVWPENARQLSVSGRVVRADPEAAARVYAQRSRYLQLLAWVNDPGLTELDEDERHRRWADFAAEHPTLAPPPTWAGFVLLAEIITFWRGAGDGPSQRVLCRRNADSWAIERLPG
jgi:pyridoxamine 5'-phosphate oxidase